MDDYETAEADPIVGHTASPWTVCGDGNCPCKTVCAADQPVAKIIVGEWDDEFPSIRLVGTALERTAEAYIERFIYGSVSEEEAHANALLIAAAPDLLAALKHCVIERSGWLDEARAAIAKAEGRSLLPPEESS